MIRNYFKVAIRNLLRNKYFSFINIMGLAVGMTACFLIFRYVRFELSYDDFHAKADRIYRVAGDVVTPTKTVHAGVSVGPVAILLKKEFPEVEDAVRLYRDGFLVTKGNIKFQEKTSVMADSSLFRIFDFPLIAGDARTALRDPMSVVLSKSAAKKYFGDANPLGQHVLLTGGAIDATVTGIMKDIPENSQIRTDMFVSLSSWEQIYGFPKQDSQWTAHNYYTYILMRPHTDAASLEKKLPAFMEFHHGADARKSQMSETLLLEPLMDVYLRSPRDGFVTGNIQNVRIFSIIGVFILIIACINFINLTTARSTVRAKEVGVRKVIGAARGQVAAQFMGESVIICWVAFALTLLAGSLMMPWLNHLAGKDIGSYFLSGPADLAMLFLLSTAIGLVAGIYPSLVLSSFKAVSVLKGRWATGTQGLLLRKGLVVFQFTISIVFVLGTIVVFKQLRYMRSQELGFSREQEMIIETNFDKNRDVFKQSLASIPGVLSTAYSSGVPGQAILQVYTVLENREGEMQKTIVGRDCVDPDFITQYDLKVVAGRAFLKGLSTDSTQAMMINESAVELLGYHSPQEALGRKWEQRGARGTIIGVLKNFHYRSLQESIQPLVLRINPNEFGTISIKLSAAGPGATIRAIEDHWRQAIPNRPFEFTFLDELFDSQYRAEDKFGDLFLHFAVLAIFISCLGLLGLASYSNFLRTKEIGVRKVLGASVSHIVHLLSVDFVKLVLIAFLIASPVGWYAMHQWLGGFAYSTTISWQVFALSGGAAILMVILTISYQAVRAAVANPVKSLRTE
ncbi:ABC transporter permease [Flavitalea sp. BT771]|uniref:ABC transporter permease n=1 Tax=Flavitalea sp. BT771 TaxID=3063329 RepID=UPI0026E40885|nr:ABC transporter permease [Flavitalea sp. BT771]MDO6430169.1 ABC transporter permease [Flavitalea sp. BT771]MDV6219692.1 ABC transporter permease [Flavitalea sp. BT771]